MFGLSTGKHAYSMFAFVGKSSIYLQFLMQLNYKLVLKRVYVERLGLI